jgi:hypothetical protein
MFFLTTHFFLGGGGSTQIWINTFSLGGHYLGVCLRVILHLGKYGI